MEITLGAAGNLGLLRAGASLLATQPQTLASPLAQDVQVDGRRLDQGLQPGVHIFDAVALLGLPLPAALHDGIDLRWAGPWPLQLPSLSDALNRLGPPEGERRGHTGLGEEREASPPGLPRLTEAARQALQ